MKTIFGFATLVVASFFSLGLAGVAYAADFTPFTTQMDLGAKGAQVSKLQTFLAADSAIYPEGIVSGYYGPLTAAAVQQFQVSYNLAQVGRVGPQTIAEMNKINANGLALDVHVPFISNVIVQNNASSPIISWSTNENTRGVLFYGTSPIQSNEQTQGFTYPYISGTSVVANNNSSNISQSVVLPSLNRGTRYYFLVESIDPSGNLSMTLPYDFVAN